MSRPFRGENGWQRQGKRCRRRLMMRLGMATRVAGPSCGRIWPTTSPEPAAYGPTPTASSSAPATSKPSTSSPTYSVRKAPPPSSVEAFGYSLHWDVIRSRGLQPHPVPVDEHGVRSDLLTGQAALLTPAHQMPLGVPLAPDRRTAAVEWAREIRSSAHRGRLRRRVPLRPPTSRRPASPRPRASRLHRYCEQKPRARPATSVDGLARAPDGAGPRGEAHNRSADRDPRPTHPRRVHCLRPLRPSRTPHPPALPPSPRPPGRATRRPSPRRHRGRHLGRSARPPRRTRRRSRHGRPRQTGKAWTSPHSTTTASPQTRPPAKP